MSKDALRVYTLGLYEQRKQGLSREEAARGLVMQLDYETGGEDIEKVESLVALLDSAYD